MIKVYLTYENEQITDLLVKGHSNSNGKGKDLICASVSSITYGLLNRLDLDYNGDCDLIDDPNFTEVKVINNNHDIQVIMKTIVIQLKTIEESYPDNLKIMEVWNHEVYLRYPKVCV